MTKRPAFVITFAITPACVRPLDSLKWLLSRAKGEGLRCTGIRIVPPDVSPGESERVTHEEAANGMRPVL